jgi:hypothetical protein
MKRMPIHLLTTCLFTAAMTITSAASALTVVREPYLQMQGPNSITIIFHTDVTIGTPQVNYGTTPALGSSATGSSAAHTTYAAVGGAAIPNTKHVVELSGLTADTKYYYSVGSTSAAITTAGEDYAFNTAPVPGTRQPIRIWTFGDSGYWPGHYGTEFQDTRQAYYDYITGAPAGTGTANDAADATDVMLYLGDNCYFFGREQDCNRVFWSPTEMAAFHRRQPFFSAIGNHEGYVNDTVTETGDFFEAHYLPTGNELGSNGTASGTESYYSFDYGNVHFIILDSEDSLEAANPAERAAMLAWLQSDLTATTADWIIAGWHRPPYSAGLVHGSDFEQAEMDAREQLLPILDDFGVDLVLSGHSHTYERTGLVTGHYGNAPSLEKSHLVDGGDGDPVGDGPYRKKSTSQAAASGTVYVVAGSPADLRWFTGADSTGPAGTTHPVMVKSLLSLGTLSIEVDGLTLTGNLIDETGAAVDTFRIEKGTRCPTALSVAGCIEAGTSKLIVKKNARTSARDSAMFKASKTEFDTADFDPFGGANNAFCLYEDGTLVLDIAAPDASFEAYDTADEFDEFGIHHDEGYDRPKVSWANKRPGLYLFKDRNRSWDGTQTVKLKGGSRGSFLFRSKGDGAAVPTPPLSSASDISIVAQVRNLDGAGCIYGVMDTPKKNEAGKFIANGTLTHSTIPEPASPRGAFVDGPLLY